MLEGFTWIQQAAYRYEGDGRTIYIDPCGLTDDAPPADAVFITHAHFDHFSQEDLDRIVTDATRIVAPHDVARELSKGDIVGIAPGDDVEAAGVKGQAVPAYNIVEERLEKHPKENGWVGFVLDLGGRTAYFAGDTDHVPDLNSIKTQLAFVPIGGTYTMDVDEAAGLIREIRPQLAVPNHYGHVVGTTDDAERFVKACDPIEARTMQPTNPFVLTDA